MCSNQLRRTSPACRHHHTGAFVGHPIVWFVFPRVGLSYIAMVWAAEILDRALILSLMANAASLRFGLALRALTGWV